MHARIVALLDELGIASVAVEPRNFSQVYHTISVLGEITHNSPGAEEVIAGMQRKIAGVEEQVHNREVPGVFWILSEEPLMSAGGETFVSEAIALAGGRNIFEDLQEQWPLVSPEQVLLRRPHWVLLGDDAQTPVEQFQRNPLWQILPAVREDRVHIINADIFYRYGPRLADAVESLAAIFHGL